MFGFVRLSTNLKMEFTDPKPTSPRDIMPDRQTGCFCPTALLRASRRIRQLEAGGDGVNVGTCMGKLYTKFGEESCYELAMENACFSIVRSSKDGNLSSSMSSNLSQGSAFSIRVLLLLITVNQAY